MDNSHAVAGRTCAGRACNKVAVVFADDESAGAAAKQLRDALHLGHGQVRVVHPHAAGSGHKPIPDMVDIKRLLFRRQSVMALGGALAGAMLFVLLWAMDVTLIVNSAIVLAALVVYGVVSGLLIGRLVGLRSDQGVHTRPLLAEVRKGHAAVIVHAHDSAERDRADAMLGSMGGMTMHPF